MTPQEIEQGNRMIAELSSRYPSGLILGAARAIVGDLGLTIHWINQNHTIGEVRYKPNQELSITEIRGNFLIISQPFPNTKVNCNFFKGFTWKTKEVK